MKLDYKILIASKKKNIATSRYGRNAAVDRDLCVYSGKNSVPTTVGTGMLYRGRAKE